MTERLRFGIVGGGRVAACYVQALEQCDGAVVAGIADTRPESANALARSADCLSYKTHEEMALDCELDAAIICTPPVTHPEISISLLDRKIHVLCEKPLAVDLRKAQAMYDAAHINKAILTMASKFRYVDDVMRAKRLVDSGKLGQVALCENIFTTRVDMSSRWNSDPEISGGGVLIDNGTHSVDLLRYLMGPLAEVKVVEGTRSQGLRVEETVSVFLRAANGLLGTVDLSWSIDKRRASYLDVYGSDGALSVGWRQSKLFDYRYGKVEVFGAGYNRTQAFQKQINNFCAAIRGEEHLLVTEEDALASVNVIGVAYRALRQMNWAPITIPLKLPREPIVPEEEQETRWASAS